MQNVIEFTEADLPLPRTQPELLAAKVLEMFDGQNPVRTLDVANALITGPSRRICTAPAGLDC